MQLLLVCVGGAVGSSARYLLATWMADRFGPAFPWGTLTVNVVGSFLIGLLATLADEMGSIGPQARTFLIIGLLGGFTTFSSFSLETVRLAEQHEVLPASLNVIIEVAVGLAAALIGIGVGRWIEFGP